MKMNKFAADQPNSYRSSCKLCIAPIPKGEIRILIKTYSSKDYFHLSCFTPKLDQYIRKADIKLKLDDESKKTFMSWLDDWNSRHFSLESPPSYPIALSKEVISSNPIHKRMLLEIFKYLEVADIVKNICLVNKEFYHVTWEQELWRELFVRDYKEEIVTDNWRLKYANDYGKACIECKTMPDVENMYICPMLKRVLCKKCGRKDDYRLLSKGQIYEIYGIKANRLKVNFVSSYNCKKVIYKKDCVKAVKALRKKKKEKILKELISKLGEDHDIVDMIGIIDVDHVDSDYSGINNQMLRYNGNRYEKYYKILFSNIMAGVASKIHQIIGGIISS